MCLSISGCYEFIEWFLGTQGDPWDIQWDMFFALIGSVVAQLSLTRIQERELRRLGVTENATDRDLASA